MAELINLNKSFRKMNQHFCNKMVEESRSAMYQNKKKSKKVETEEITIKEQIFKGQDIELFFEGDKENFSDLRLKVFVNGQMKFVSQEDSFIIETVQIPKIVRSGWFFKTEFKERKRLKFKQQEEFERFQKFSSKLRDCSRVNELFSEVRYDYVSNL